MWRHDKEKIYTHTYTQIYTNLFYTDIYISLDIQFYTLPVFFWFLHCLFLYVRSCARAHVYARDVRPM